MPIHPVLLLPPRSIHYSSRGRTVSRLYTPDRWDGFTKDFVQEDCYRVPEVVKMEFQAAQGQLAWLASRGQETSDHTASVEWCQEHGIFRTFSFLFL